MLNLAVQFIIIWSQTTIYVPLGTNLEDYKYLPVATLLESQCIINDDDMYYEYEVNRTFFRVVNTNHLGTYRVDYKVYFPTYHKNAEQTITFIVIDDIAPEITSAEDLYIPLGDKKYDLATGLNYQDNYDSKELLEVQILGTETINFNKTGKYPIIYQIKDTSGNIASKQIFVHIKDYVPPYIKQNKGIALYLNQSFKYEDYFEIKDDYDGLVRIRIDDQKVNYQKAGIYLATIYATDQSGNEASAVFDLNIIEDDKPKIIQTKPLVFEVFDIEPYWQDYFTLSHEKDLDYFMFKFTTKTNMNKINNYTLEVEVSGDDQVKYKQTFKVEVKDTKPPVIKQGEDIVITDFKKINFDEYFTAKDAYDGVLALNFDDHQINYEDIGNYPLKVSATDASGNQTIMVTSVLVKDLTIPVLKLSTDAIYLAVFKDEMPNFSLYIDEIYDAYDKDLNIEDVYISHVIDLDKVGRYEVKFELFDKQGNFSVQNLVVYVQDRQAPTLVIREIKLKAGAPFVYLNYMEAHDNYDGDVTHKIIQATEGFDTNTPGKYELLFMVIDQQGNTAVEKALVTIEKVPKIPFYLWIVFGITIFTTILIFVYLKRKNKSTSF